MDKTVFHPQGGGQPADKGLISLADGSVKFQVADLQTKGDAILHVGKYIDSAGKFKTG